jgi:hypothetical protein
VAHPCAAVHTAARSPETGLRSHQHHQPHPPAAPSTSERYETPDPVRSDAVKAQFQCVLTPRETPVPWRPGTDFHDQLKPADRDVRIRACARLSGTYGFTRSGSGPPRRAIVVASAAWHPGLRMPFAYRGARTRRGAEADRRPVPFSSRSTGPSAGSDGVIRRFRPGHPPVPVSPPPGVPPGAGLGSIGTRGKVRR